MTNDEQEEEELEELDKTEDEDEEEASPYSCIDDFFQNAPPGSSYRTYVFRQDKTYKGIKVPVKLRYFCPHVDCAKVMDHEFVTTLHLQKNEYLLFDSGAHFAMACYRCKHCETSEKFISLQIHDRFPNEVTLLGTYPTNCEPLPESLLDIADFDEGMLLKGYEAEIDGYGLGAYAYYRRVVENRWQALLKKMREVAVETGATQQVITHLDSAINQRQFEQAVKSLGDAVPREFFHKENNLFTLLHRMTSIGVHNLPDGDCLTNARALRHVLTLFVRRAELALAEADTVENAVIVVGKVVQSARAKPTT